MNLRKKSFKLEENEVKVYEVRKHWLIFAFEILATILMALIPLLVVSYLFKFGIDFSFLGEHPYAFMAAVYSLWVFILWMFSFVFWTNYYLDVWIITDKKIVDIEQHGLFKREISFMQVDKIQDVTYGIDGFWATLLNYGDVKVQTAGAVGFFTIKGIPNPALVQSKINEAILMNKLNVKNAGEKVEEVESEDEAGENLNS